MLREQTAAYLKGLIVPTILIADDNSNIQKMVSLVFKEKGVRVVAVGNGEAACRKVPEVHPDVVLADVFMPVRNGYEVCEFVKQDPQFAETPVILLVGAFDPLDEKEAQRVGANGVLKKPFVPPEPLIAMVSSLLKIEPPSEKPQPTPAPEEAAMLQSEAEAGPTARQIAIASAQAQFAGTDADETVITFSAPAAAPSPQAQEIEEDDSEPASEWAKRRATVDYEIDDADSADMVEKLAAQGATEEPEIQAANKHLPFGGASVPETLESHAPEPSRYSGEWSEPEAEISAAPQSSSFPPAGITEEFSLPTPVEEQQAPTFTDQESTPRYEEADVTPPAALMRVTPPSDLDVVPETAITDPADVHEASHEPPFDTFPEIHIAQPSAQAKAPFVSEPFEPFDQADTEASFTEEAALAEALTFSKADVPSTVSPEPEMHGVLPENALPGVARVEPSAEEAPSKTPIDQATVDDVVARVISKLEPQLHQALANGVLRPLVEEVLNQKREKK